MKIYLSILILTFSMLFSCTSKKEEGAPPPSPPSATSQTISAIEIQPLEATRETTFSISSKSLDVSKANIQWFINDTIVEGATSKQFRPAEVKKGATVQAKATVNNQEFISNQVRIKNILPSIVNAKIMPSNPKMHDILKLNITGNDRDGDPISYKYEWIKNGEPVSSSETLEGPFKREDKISVKITPYDGEGYGFPSTLSTNIFNSPPKPSGTGESFENNIYTYQIKATDPDGDIPTYNLKQAPKGMVIDKSTGLITWQVTEKDTGRYPVVVQISDGHGGEVLYNLEVTIGFERR